MGTEIFDGSVQFPNIDNYDMNKPGEMALYLAYCDFLPFRSVIENNKLAIEALSEAYTSVIEKAHIANDFVIEEWALRNKTLHMSKVDLLTQYSLLLTMVSLFEEAVNTLCRVYQSVLVLVKQLEDIKGEGMDRACTYLKTEVGVQGFKADKQWEYISVIREARNMIVHNGGRISKGIEKFDKFGIGYREEDKQIYVEYEDIIKMYDALIDFMDRTFRIEPIVKTAP